MSRWILLAGGPETLLGAERALARSGIRLDRVLAFQYEPVPHGRLRRALARFGRYDLLLFTSKESVRVMGDAGLLPSRLGPRTAPEVVAGGPETSRALRAWGVRASWIPGDGTGRAAADRIGTSPTRRIVYARSDRAGPSLARSLKRRGHEVLDLVAYRVRPPARPTSSLGARLRRAEQVLVTSPSALSFLRRSLSSTAFAEFRQRGVLVVLGTKSLRSARGHGFRRVRAVPDVTERSVVRFLVSGARHAG